MSLLTAPVNGCDMSTSCTPKSVFGDFATPCQSSSISSTPGSVSSFATPHSRAQPRAVSLSARTIADAHAALEELCSRSRSTPSACLDTSIASSDDDTWVARSNSAASQSMTVFDSAVVPSISLGEYGVALASRIPHLNAELTLAAVVLCRRYIGTMRTAPTAAMMHRLYATAFYLVMCSHSDVVVTPSNFAAVAGLDAKEMPRLTRELLLAVDWRTQVTRDQLEILVASCDPLL